MRVTLAASLALVGCCLVRPVRADAPASPAEFAAQVVAAAGGEERLLTMFSFRERVVVSSEAPPPPTADEPGNRTSIVELGGGWWVDGVERNKDKVRVLAWAWSLRLLLDAQSELELLPSTTLAERSVVGVRVSQSIAAPLDCYFDAETLRLVAIDYDDTRHLFSEWKETADGRPYASRAIGYRFVDRAAGTVSAEPWYQTDILELTPLAELPADLKR